MTSRYNHMKKIIFLFLITYSLFRAVPVNAQEKDLGNGIIETVKPYKPVLSESFKISDTPDADTSSSNPSRLNYNVTPKKIETNYEAGVIKAVRLKDEPITKLYRSLLKLGIGNYSTYYGELFVNSLRSKTGSLGLHLKHFSGSPGIPDAGVNTGFSENEAGVFGKYFFENSTFSGDVNFNRHFVHYYGFDVHDPVVFLIETDDRQGFNNFSMNLGLQSNNISKGDLDYDFHFRFNSISDLYDVTEPDVIVSGLFGKPVDEKYFSLFASFDFFKKSDSNFERLYLDPLNHNLSRNIIHFQPQVKIDKDKYHLVLGVGLDMEKNLGTILHLFPKAEISIPIAEHVLTAFAGVDGNVEKNNFKTITDENPFAISTVIPRNTIHKLILKGGLRGNFSNTISFSASAGLDQMKDLQLFYNDTNSFLRSRFNVVYDNTDVFNVHAEISYQKNEKLNISLHVDQYSYSTDLEYKAWHKPGSIISLAAKYNLHDKIIADVSVFAHGVQYAKGYDGNYIVAEKISGYMDLNLGVEYRYSKILSLYVHMNNLGFSRYYNWSQYPSERFNLLGGLTYAF